MLPLHFIKVQLEIPCWELTYHTYGRGNSSSQHAVNPHSKVAMDGMGEGGDALECRFLHESLQEGGEVWVRVEVGDRYSEYMSLSLAMCVCGPCLAKVLIEGI